LGFLKIVLRVIAEEFKASSDSDQDLTRINILVFRDNEDLLGFWAEILERE